MTTSRPAAGAVGRGLWTLSRFGLTPAKAPARLMNRGQPAVLAVSIPKAGTHLLERALCLHPRLYRRITPTLNEVNLARWGQPQALLERLRPGQVLMAHLFHSEARARAVSTAGVRTLFLVRDPRDIVVSIAHFVAANPDHRVHDLFLQEPTLKDRILLAIEGAPQRRMPSVGELLQRFEGWLDGDAMVIRFEDLVGSAGGGDDGAQSAALRAMFEHLGVSADDRLVASIGARLFSSRSPTFRRGAIGGWQGAFDADLREAFERTAGGYLERYGYAPVG